MRSFSDFFAYLGCPMTNNRWSWSAIATDRSRILFTIWGDEVRDRKYVLYPTSSRRPGLIPEDADNRLGAEEIARLAKLAAKNPDIEAYGVLTIAKDTTASTRARATYDDRTVFRLRVEEHDGQFIAHLVERPEVHLIVKKS